MREEKEKSIHSCPLLGYPPPVLRAGYRSPFARLLHAAFLLLSNKKRDRSNNGLATSNARQKQQRRVADREKGRGPAPVPRPSFTN